MEKSKVYSATSGDPLEAKDDNEMQETQAVSFNILMLTKYSIIIQLLLILKTESRDAPSRMRSSKFFILHVLFNTVLMCCVSSFLFTTSEDLDSNSDDALVIPQLLGVVPGLDSENLTFSFLISHLSGMAFSIGYCFSLHDYSSQSGDIDTHCKACCGR